MEKDTIPITFEELVAFDDSIKETLENDLAPLLILAQLLEHEILIEKVIDGYYGPLIYVIYDEDRTEKIHHTLSMSIAFEKYTNKYSSVLVMKRGKWEHIEVLAEAIKLFKTEMERTL